MKEFVDTWVLSLESELEDIVISSCSSLFLLWESRCLVCYLEFFPLSLNPLL